MSNFTSHRGLKIAKKVHFRKLPLFKIHFGAIFNEEIFFWVQFPSDYFRSHFFYYDVEILKVIFGYKFCLRKSTFLVEENETGKKNPSKKLSYIYY